MALRIGSSGVGFFFIFGGIVAIGTGIYLLASFTKSPFPGLALLFLGLFLILSPMLRKKTPGA